MPSFRQQLRKWTHLIYTHDTNIIFLVVTPLRSSIKGSLRLRLFSRFFEVPPPSPIKILWRCCLIQSFCFSGAHAHWIETEAIKVQEVEGEEDSSCTVCLLWWLVIPWSVWDCCVSVFSLCGLCLFIVDSTVERQIPLLTVSLKLRVKMSIWVFNPAAHAVSPRWLRASL